MYVNHKFFDGHLALSSLLLTSIVVAHASLFIQNISVTVCSIVLMLVFSYKKWIEQIWDGWLTVSMIIYLSYNFFLSQQ